MGHYRSTTHDKDLKEHSSIVVKSTTRPCSPAGRILVCNPEGRFRLFRIGHAVASRNIYAAVYDALRLVKDVTVVSTEVESALFLMCDVLSTVNRSHFT